MLLLFHTTLVVVILLFTINTFLDGTWKQSMASALSIVWVGLLALAFFVFGWKAGLAAVLLSFAYGTLVRPAAHRVAFYLMALGSAERGDHRYVGLPPRWLARLSVELGRITAPEKMLSELMAGRDPKRRALDELLDRCQADSDVRSVLERHGGARGTLEEAYARLRLIGAGQWAGGHYVAASVLAYPGTLDYWLATPVDEPSRMTAAVRLIHYFQFGASLRSRD